MAILRWFGVEWRLRPLMMHELQQEEGALRRHPCKTSRHSASPSVTAEQSFAFILAALKRGHRSIGSSPWQYPTLKQMVIIKITPGPSVSCMYTTPLGPALLPSGHSTIQSLGIHSLFSINGAKLKISFYYAQAGGNWKGQAFLSP